VQNRRQNGANYALLSMQGLQMLHAL